MRPGTLITAGFVATILAAPVLGQALMVDDFNAASPADIAIREQAPGSVTAELVADDSGGKCLAVKFTRLPKAGYAYARLPIVSDLTAKGKDCDGITFKLKGDGSKTFGTIEIRTDDSVNIYQAVFPLDGKPAGEWGTIELRWDDFFQINDNVAEESMDLAAANSIAFGSRCQWDSCRFAVYDVAFAKLPKSEPLSRPAGGEKLPGVLAKLEKGEPVTIVALGDSITFGTKVSSGKRATGLYFQVAAAGLEKAFPKAKVSTVNAGVAGDIIGEGIVRIGHDVAAKDPDLVIVLLGANDAIYRFPDARVRGTMSILLAELMKTTTADILLIGPTPVSDRAGVAEGYARVYAGLAAERHVAYLDLGAALDGLAAEDRARFFADNVHWSEYGHEAMGRAVLDFLLSLAREKDATGAGGN